MTKLYNKSHPTTNTNRLQFDPAAGRFVFAMFPEPDPEPQFAQPPEPDPEPQFDNISKRYRLAALSIVDPERIKYYLDMATKLEDAKEVEVAIGDRGPVVAIAKNPINDNGQNDSQTAKISLSGEIAYSVRVHSQLAQTIVSGKEFTRAYALWSVLRSVAGPGHLDKQSVIDLAMSKTGKAQSTIYNWLSQGEGVFWNSGDGQLWLIGRDKVIDFFLGPGIKPGTVVMVPADLLLTSKLHRVRAALSSTWVTSDNGKIAARSTRRTFLQGVPERTQQTYDATAGVKIRPLSVRSKTQKKQISNQYFRPDSFTTLGIDKPSKRQFYGYRATDFNAVVSAQMSVVANGNGFKFGGNRMYFNDQSRAVKVAEFRRDNDIPIPVYWLNPDDQKSDSGPAVRVTWLW